MNATDVEKTASKTASPRFAPAPPQGGAQLPLGAHPQNTGGKKGRSGRRPSELREALRKGIDRHGINLVADTLAGRVSYTLEGKCEHCGKKSGGSKEKATASASLDTRLRAFELAARYSIGPYPSISVADLRIALKASLDLICAHVSPEKAEEIIAGMRAIWGNGNIC